MPIKQASPFVRFAITVDRGSLRGQIDMRLLLINANTTEAVTLSCADVARRVASIGTEIVPLTGRFGAAIIESRAENAIAAHALLELVAEHRGKADAALIAVSYDTALLPAREIAGFPVLGITQASLSVACLLGSRIGMVTFGTPGLYRELAEGYGCESRPLSPPARRSWRLQAPTSSFCVVPRCPAWRPSSRETFLYRCWTA